MIFSNKYLTFSERVIFSKEINNFLSKYMIYMYIYINIYMYIYNHRTTCSGSSRGSSSGVATGAVGGAQARPAWCAADRDDRGACYRCCCRCTLFYDYIYIHTLNFYCCSIVWKHMQKHVFNLFIYTEKDIESHRNMQINDL